MKKSTKIILSIIGIVLLVVICTLVKPNDGENNTTSNGTEDSADLLARAQQQSAAVKDEEKKDFVSVNVSEYLEKYRDSDPHIVLIARTSCGYCQIAEPILHKIAKDYDLEIFHLNTDDITSDDDLGEFVNSNEYFSSGFGTPLLLITKNSTLEDYLEGLADYEGYVDFLKDNHFIEG